jgi:hypothetical protein
MTTPLYSPSEATAGFNAAKTRIAALLGWEAAEVPDADITLIVGDILTAAAQVRAKAAPSAVAQK